MRRCRSLDFVVLLVVVAVVGARADDDTAVVDPGRRFQTFEGWGVSLCWSGKVIGAFPEAVRNEYAGLLFSPTKGLGFNLARYNVGGGENPALPFMGFRERMEGYEPAPGQWNWNADAGQRWLLQAAKARGANIFEAFSNSPPWWMTVSGSVTGGKDPNANNLAREHEADFASYLVEVVEHFRRAWGINFRTLEPLNEANTNWWHYGGSQEGCRFDPPAQARILLATSRALAGKGLDTKLSASDENNIDTAVSTFQAFDPGTRGLIWQVNTHSYGGSHRSELAKLAAAPRKGLWMSEYGDGDESGMTLAGKILDDLNGLHPLAWIYWQALDIPSWGLLANCEDGKDTSYRVMPKFWVLMQFSRFIRPGATFVEIDDASSVAALGADGRSLVVVTVNRGDTERRVTLDLSRFNTFGARVTSFRSSARENCAALPSAEVRGGRFSSALPPKSVTTFVFSGVGR